VDYTRDDARGLANKIHCAARLRHMGGDWLEPDAATDWHIKMARHMMIGVIGASRPSCYAISSPDG
jgi:hypothetical protein